MGIERIEITNFRGLREAVIDGCRDVNVFVGPNGTGKSSILEAIYAAPAHVHGNPVLQKDRGSVIAERRGETPWDPGMQYSYKVPDHARIILDFPGADNRAAFAIYRGRHPEVVQGPRDKTPIFTRFLQQIIFLDSSLRALSTFETCLWDSLLQHRADKEIISELNKLYHLKIEGLTYVPTPPHVKCLFANSALKMSDLGAGMRIAFRFLVACSQVRGTAVLFEELDSYQHPDTMASLAHLILHLAKSRKLQFFMTTHSLETCRILAKAAQGSLTTLAFYTLVLDRTGLLTAKRSEGDSADRLMEAGYDLRNP